VELSRPTAGRTGTAASALRREPSGASVTVPRTSCASTGPIAVAHSEVNFGYEMEGALVTLIAHHRRSIPLRRRLEPSRRASVHSYVRDVGHIYSGPALNRLRPCRVHLFAPCPEQRFHERRCVGYDHK